MADSKPQTGPAPVPNTSTDHPNGTLADAAKAPKVVTAQTTRGRRAARAEVGPRYKVLAQSQIDNALVGPGTNIPEVTYFGLPGKALKPINAEAKARKKQVRDIQDNGKLDAAGKQAALTALSDKWNGVERRDDLADLDDSDDD